MVHLPGFHFGYLFLTHSHAGICNKAPSPAPQPPWAVHRSFTSEVVRYQTYSPRKCCHLCLAKHLMRHSRHPSWMVCLSHLEAKAKADITETHCGATLARSTWHRPLELSSLTQAIPSRPSCRPPLQASSPVERDSRVILRQATCVLDSLSKPCPGLWSEPNLTVGPSCSRPPGPGRHESTNHWLRLTSQSLAGFRRFPYISP